jgi:hypothetical protein
LVAAVADTTVSTTARRRRARCRGEDMVDAEVDTRAVTASVPPQWNESVGDSRGIEDDEF